MLIRTVVAIGVALSITIAAGLTWGLRWYLRLDDLESFAKPEGFIQVGYERSCPGAGNGPCSHVWILASDNAAFDAAKEDVTRSLEARGWQVVQHVRGSGISAREPDHGRCRNYHELTRPEDAWILRDPERLEDELTAYRSAIMVTSSCG